MVSAQGKTVIVTGAGSGLGKVIATSFLAAGANVAACDVVPQRVTDVSNEWSGAYANKFIAKQVDVTDPAAVQGLVDETVAAYGRLDVVVNAAGIMDAFEPVGDLPKEKWDRVLNVNLTGPYLLTKAAIGQFQKQKEEGSYGVIINIGSSACVNSFQSGAAYTVSKAGLMALTKNTAGFYGDKGIYSICLMLGGMNTNISDAFANGMHMEMYQMIQAAHTPFGPDLLVPLESVAKYCIFLADKDIAPSANGSCIPFTKNWPKA